MIFCRLYRHSSQEIRNLKGSSNYICLYTQLILMTYIDFICDQLECYLGNNQASWFTNESRTATLERRVQDEQRTQ